MGNSPHILLILCQSEYHSLNSIIEQLCESKYIYDTVSRNEVVYSAWYTGFIDLKYLYLISINSNFRLLYVNGKEYVLEGNIEMGLVNQIA